jgi:hypothetical protein
VRGLPSSAGFSWGAMPLARFSREGGRTLALHANNLNTLKVAGRKHTFPTEHLELFWLPRTFAQLALGNLFA